MKKRSQRKEVLSTLTAFKWITWVSYFIIKWKKNCVLACLFTRYRYFTERSKSRYTVFEHEITISINEIWRLKEVSLNWGSSFFKENFNAEYLKCYTSFYIGKTLFLKVNNKQHILEKLLNINSNQSKVNDSNIINNGHVNKNYSVWKY